MSSTTLELNSEVVRAGAGAGKTTALTQRVLDVARLFFDRHQRAPRIVVTTFTRKATEELRERLVRRACESGDQRLIQFVTGRSYLQISTIHGVLSQFLQRFGHLLGIDSGFQVVDTKTIDRLAKVTLREILKSNLEFAPLLEDYTFSKLSQMMQVVLPDDVSAVTADELRDIIFSHAKQIADDLLNLSRQISNEATDEKWLSYMKHIESCALYLHDHAEELNFKDWLNDFQSHKKPNFQSKKPPFSIDTNERFEVLRERVQDLAKEEYSLDNCDYFADRARLFAKLKQQFDFLFEQKKRQSGYVEFDDLERLSLKALREHPEVAMAFSADWDYWLIDEFQDTSPVQVELLNGLVGHKPVYVVGDPQQSIYIFRGARSEVFAAKEAEITEGGGKRSELLKNYRSRPELLLFFNDFFKRVSDAFLPMEPKDVAPADGDDPVARFYMNSAHEKSETPYAPLAQFILSRVANKQEQFDDFCVLARTRDQLYDVAQYLNSLQIPTHVHSNDGFYSRREVLDLLSFTKFLLNPHDNENMIRLLRSPWVRVPDRLLAEWVSDKKSSFWLKLVAHKGECEAIDYLTQSLEQVSKQGVFETVRRFATDRGLLVSSHYHDSTGRRESNIWKYLHKLSEGERTAGFQYQKFVFDAFREALSSSGDEGESDAVAALEPNRVNLMTIHKSKGLKFKHVLLPNLEKQVRTSDKNTNKTPLVYDEYNHKFHLQVALGEDRKLKHSLYAHEFFTQFSEQERAENLRLLYVALTRAEHSVLLQWREKVAENSWAQFCQSWANEEGLHKRDHYAFEVSRNFEEPQPFVEEGRETSLARTKWVSQSQNRQDDTLPRVSVTQWLERGLSKSESKGNAVKGVLQSVPSPQSLKFEDHLVLSDEKLKLLNKKVQAPVIGQRLHSFFESLKYHSRHGRYSMDELLNQYVERWLPREGADFRAAVNYVLDLKEPPIRELILSGEVEWGFQLKTESEILEGQIDLWGVVNDTLWVIDYKSGSAEHEEKAFAQLECYARALHVYKKASQIKLAVIFARDRHAPKRDFHV